MKKLKSAALAALMIFLLASCGGRGPENRVFSAGDMEGATVGVLESSAAAEFVRRDAGAGEIKYYTDVDSLAGDLEDGTLDCAVAGEEQARDIVRVGSGLETLEEPFFDGDFTLAVSVDNSQLLENLEDAMTYLRASGKLRDIQHSWDGGDPGTVYEPDPEYTDISVAVDAEFFPYAYLDDSGELRGLEVDIVRALCAYLSLTPVFTPVEPDMLLYMAESGKTAFALGRIAADPSNDAVAFTSPYLHSTQLIVVRK